MNIMLKLSFIQRRYNVYLVGFFNTMAETVAVSISREAVSEDSGNFPGEPPVTISSPCQQKQEFIALVCPSLETNLFNR